MHEVSAKSVLIQARWLISDPAKWTQECSARDEHGDALEDGYDPKAVRWCAIGAIEKVSGKDSFSLSFESDTPYNILRAAMGDYVGDYNDSHTHAEVIAAFDKAIANAVS